LADVGHSIKEYSWSLQLVAGKQICRRALFNPALDI